MPALASGTDIQEPGWQSLHEAGGDFQQKESVLCNDVSTQMINAGTLVESCSSSITFLSKTIKHLTMTIATLFTIDISTACWNNSFQRTSNIFIH